MYHDKEQRKFARELRNNTTPAERHLWQALRAQQLDGYKFRRQAAIGPYIVDFVCFSHQLVIELDGVHHALGESPQRDAARTAWLESRGFQVLRFWNHQLDEGLKLVVDEIRGALKQAQPPSPTLPAEGREPEKLDNRASGRDWRN